MSRATGGFAFGEISMRSIPSAGRASASAFSRGRTPRFFPSSPMTRSSGEVIWLLILGFSMGVGGMFRCLLEEVSFIVAEYGHSSKGAPPAPDALWPAVWYTQGMDSVTAAAQGAPAAPASPGAPVEHAEVLDGKYHKLGKKTLWLFVLDRIRAAMILLVVTIAAFSIQGQPWVATAFGKAGAAYVDEAAWWLLLLFLVVFALSYFIAWLIYVNYKFLIGEDALRISRGIFSKEVIAIPYRQIQDADIERSLYFRMFGVSKLVILTAGREDVKAEGGDEAEGILPAMDKGLAEWMQKELLRRTEVQRVVAVGQDALDK